MMKMASMIVEKDNRNLNQGIILLIHDEALAQYKDEEIVEKTKYVEDCMLKAGSYICNNVPMYAVGEYGKEWIH